MMNRREALKNLGLAGLGSFLGAKSVSKRENRNRVLRVAHLTDVHLHDKNDAPKHFAKCLEAVQAMADQPDIILNGGDTIFDALAQNKMSVDKQWKLWHGIVDTECEIPMMYCIGNHDVWAGGAKTESLYGKAFALDQMKLEAPYYYEDKAGWRFIVLDSTHPVGEGWYTGKLDEAQYEWLKETLENTPSDKPILVLSHIPILTATGFYEENAKEGKWEIPGSWMHIDFARIRKLFDQHKNVKLCLSGHMHLLDKVEYNDVTYCCNGAVSGNWWGNEYYHQTHCGYATVDLFDDGSFDVNYHLYKW